MYVFIAILSDLGNDPYFVNLKKCRGSSPGCPGLCAAPDLGLWLYWFVLLGNEGIDSNVWRFLTLFLLYCVRLFDFSIEIISGLFVEKIREYATKKKAAGGKFVDATKETEADLAAELEKVAKNYGGGKGVDMSKFPDFKWAEPAVETPDLK